MKIDSKQIRSMLKERLKHHGWVFSYDRDKDQLRIEDSQSKKGITVSIAPVVSKFEEKQDAAIEEVAYHIEEALKVMIEKQHLEGKEKQIFPVIRSTSFPTESKEGQKLLFDEHTAETRIYYALDLGKTYRLIDVDLLKRENWDEERVKEIARFNLRSLPVSVKQETVVNNVFYFINTNDGYDASRILNDSFLEKMALKIDGAMALAVPHQDVLIIADIINDQGYDILAQMTMQFFAEGMIPITALPFLYEENELEPIFILAKNKPKDKK